MIPVQFLTVRATVGSEACLLDPAVAKASALFCLRASYYRRCIRRERPRVRNCAVMFVVGRRGGGAARSWRSRCCIRIRQRWSQLNSSAWHVGLLGLLRGLL